MTTPLAGKPVPLLAAAVTALAVIPPVPANAQTGPAPARAAADGLARTVTLITPVRRQ